MQNISSIRLKLTALVASVVLLTVVGLSIAGYVIFRGALQTQIHERLAVVASDRQKLVLAFAQMQEERALLVASRTRLRQLLAELIAQPEDRAAVQELQRILQDALLGTTGVQAILVADPAGNVLGSTEPGFAGRSLREEAAFREGLKRTGLHLLAADQAPIAWASAPARIANDQLVGVVLLRLDAQPLREVLLERTGLGETGAVALGTRQGEEIRYLVTQATGTETLATTHTPAMQAATRGEEGFVEELDHRGTKVLAAYRPVGYQDWGIVTKIEAAEAYAAISAMGRVFVSVQLVMFGLAVAGSYWLATRFAGPIRRLATMAESIAGGGLHAHVVIESKDEIGSLGQAFNKMSEELSHSYAILESRVLERTAELQAERDLLQSLLDNSPDHIYFKDPKSRFLRLNRALAATFERPMDEVIGKTDFDFFSTEHAQQAFDDEQRILRTGEFLLGKEEKETWPNGRISWVSTTKGPLRDSKGKVVGTFGISRDITDQKRAEEELRRYFQLSPDLFCIADDQGCFRRVSPAWTELLGYSEAELMAEPFLSFVHEADQASTVAEYQKLCAGRHCVQFENRYRCKDGSYRWLQWNAIPVPDQKVIHAVARDVSDHKRAQELLSRFADALNRKNLEMQEDLKMAREVHQVFVPHDYPRFPSTVGVEQSALRFAHRYLPTSTLGGDFFEIIPISPHEAGVLICDVMGHGIRAALVTSILRGLLDKFHVDAGDPGKFLADINQSLVAHLQNVSSTIFATACYIIIDIRTGRLRSANAGHPPPFVVRPGVRLVERLNGATTGHAPALGLINGVEYETVTQVLGVRDRLLLFTDGIYEVESADGRQFGLDRLEEAVRRRVHTANVQLLDELLLESRRYSASGEFTDDVCMVSVELSGLVP